MASAVGVARAFATFRPLHAYRLDIIGSILGIILFTIASILRLPPIAWVFAVALLFGATIGRRATPLHWTALGLALTCADLVGTMRGAVELAREYASSRKQYGVPIGSFQAVQHLLADAHVATEGSRSAALHAAWAVDALPPSEALAAAALAKAYCARAARPVCETAIQVHGGIGNTWECLAHVHLRRALLSSDVLGGADASLDRVLADHGIGHHETGIAHGLR